MAGKGGRPTFRVVAVNKDKDADNRYTEVGAAWPSDRIEGSYNLKIADGIKLKHPEAGVISAETHFFNLEPAQKPKKDSAPKDDPSSDIPF